MECTASAPGAAPCMNAPSPVTSSARLPSHQGWYSGCPRAGIAASAVRRRHRVARLAVDPVPGQVGTGEVLAEQPGDEQDRAARPVVDHDVLSLAGRVAVDLDDHAGGLAADRGDVVLEEAVVAVGPVVVELLELVQRLGGDDHVLDVRRAAGRAVHRRRLERDVVGQVVQPGRVVVGGPAGRIAASQVRRLHQAPPPEVGAGTGTAPQSWLSGTWAGLPVR